MERLTEITHRGAVHLKGTVANYSSISYECQLEEGSRLLKEALKKLAEYENAEENGLLMMLQCHVGDRVYVKSDVYEIWEIFITDTQFYARTRKIGTNGQETHCFDLREIGKTVFLTKAEAEAKLAEMEGEHGTT